MRVVATAGHVDHGKSTLVLALTGTDPDRLAEEKSRGMTIDLGFAATTLAGGYEVSFVDVPGHARFVRNMLAGVGAVDACLFVVAATEGWKAQSEEHLRILDVLGTSSGVVALTKVAGLDEYAREVARIEVAERTAGTFLAGAEVVPLDVPAGIGLEDLASALRRLVGSAPAAADRGRPRVWVDRSFAIRGAGTVVTGTLTGGTLAVGDELALEPGGRRVRVRGLESHHEALERAGPGRRLALNLAGISHDRVRRGQALVRSGQWHMCSVFDASLRVLPSVAHPVTTRGAYLLYAGSAEVPVRVRMLGGRREVLAGDEAAARVWLGGRALPLVAGDRYVLREAGRDETVGGGEILDVSPVLPARRAAPSRSVERVVAERGWVDAGELERLTGERRVPDLGRWVVDPAAMESTHQQIGAACRDAGAGGVDVASLDERARAVLAGGVPGLTVAGGRAYETQSAPSADPDEAARRILARLESSRWSPPDLPLADRAALRDLERRGLAVEAGPVWFASSAVDDAVCVVSGLLARTPAGFTVSAAREALGTTRKHAVPLLELLDRRGVTRRQGDVRLAGPRMPAGEGGSVAGDD
ncbi:MAG: selenocysteine-specific translation elongation factor [Acidimicrobiales bacterium]